MNAYAQAFWQSKRVLVTGGEGFVATHLMRELNIRGANVFCNVRARKRRISSLDFFDVRDKVTLFMCDLRDSRRLFDIISDEKIDTVFHLGAYTLVGGAAANPLYTFEVNVLGTANVLDACRQAGSVERIVVASTDKAYGYSAALPYRESYCLRGTGIYDASKSACEYVAQAYRKEFGLPIVIARPANVYGEGDTHFSRLVPGTTARLLEGQPPAIRQGQGNVKREYIHVNDLARAYVQLAESVTKTEDESPWDNVYNIGSGNVKTTLEMISMMQSLMGSRLEPVEIGRSSRELPDQYLDSDKISRHTGWSAEIDLEVGLQRTTSWYEAHQEALRPLYLSEIADPPHVTAHNGSAEENGLPLSGVTYATPSYQEVAPSG